MNGLSTTSADFHKNRFGGGGGETKPPYQEGEKEYTKERGPSYEVGGGHPSLRNGEK